MYFASNIKFLRHRNKITQEKIAENIGTKRTSINNYENGYAEPPLSLLTAISKYFGIAIDILINIDLKAVSDSKLRFFELSFDEYIKGTSMRILATTIDSKNRENIEVVPHKAKAGYTTGYNDPEYISGLPTFQLPFLSNERKYRCFQINGDSMHPIPNGAYITAEFVNDWHDIKDGNAYIVLMENDGIVFKVLYNQIRLRKKLLLKSLNIQYEPYEIDITEVKEVWKFVNYISNQMPEFSPELNQLDSSVTLIQEEMRKITEVLKKKPKSLLKKTKAD